MYEFHLNTMAVPASVLYEDLSLLTYENYKKQCVRKKIKKLVNGGNGRVSLVEFASLPEGYKKAIKNAYGNPYKQDDLQRFVNQLENNTEAYLYFSETYKKEFGTALLPEEVDQHYAESQVLDLYGKLVERLELKQHQGIRLKMGNAKTEICDVIQSLRSVKDEFSGRPKYPIGQSFPKNYRALDNKYARYRKEKYVSLVHKAKGNTNSKKIKGPVADWILAFYCLPNKPVIPVLHTAYMRERLKYDWPTLSESAMQKWINEPEQRKIWVLERHGISEWRAEFGHKLKRDRSDWFPNAYWAIDGSKLDWIHFKDNDSGMGTDVKIDVLFDVYSERILGYSYSLSETHVDHFKAVKMAVNNCFKRPYLFTYDGQSGHTSSIMQGLYSRLVAKNGGEHYKHAARQHGSPAEGLFSRFQQQILNTKWFSDKQGVKSKKANSHANFDFIEANKHRLKTIEALERIFEQCVKEWNEALHPDFDETRSSVYAFHPQTISEDIAVYEMMDLFWVFPSKPSNYGTSGIEITVTGESHEYEVYDTDGDVDLDFRDRYTHKKFYVQYDPAQMDNFVRLWLALPNGNKQYVADAQPKRLTKQIPALMSAGDKARMHADRHVKSKELERVRHRIKQLQQSTGLTPDKLIEDQELNMKLGGNLPKETRNRSESLSYLDRM